MVKNMMRIASEGSLDTQFLTLAKERIGVILARERSPDNNRLHFHGIFYIPEGTMPGELIKVNDYNFNTKRRQITNQNTYFNERFGRSDFDEIKDPRRKGDAPAYLLKYIEKTGEKIVYSKGLPQFVKSDIREEDIITAMGMEDNKLLLYDDFTCIDEGRHLYQDKHTPCSQVGITAVFYRNL